jgi:hypothetical protein
MPWNWEVDFFFFGKGHLIGLWKGDVSRILHKTEEVRQAARTELNSDKKTWL